LVILPVLSDSLFILKKKKKKKKKKKNCWMSDRRLYCIKQLIKVLGKAKPYVKYAAH
jgi:hypothetical protein